MEKIVLIGGGGHCRSVMDAIIKAGVYQIVGITDTSTFGRQVGPSKIIGDDTIWVSLLESGVTNAFVTIGGLGSSALRRKLYARAKGIGFFFPQIVDPSASIAMDAVIGDGVFVGKTAVINANAIIETMTIVNSGAIVEHECRIGAFSHIAPGTVLCGAVTIGADVHVGAGSTIIQGLKVGDGTTIGAGSLVLSSLPPRIKAFGSPCKEVID